MATKGDRARLEPVAKQMFVDGQSLVAIEETLGVSRQSLAEWKDWGGWDKAKAAKDNYEAQLVTVRDQIMERVTEAPLQAASYLDSLAKIDAIIFRRTKAAREAGGGTYDRPKVFLENLQWIFTWLQANNPEGLKIIAESFDGLTTAFKESLDGAA